MKLKLHGTGTGTDTADREPRTRLVSNESGAEVTPQLVSRIDEALQAFTGRNLVAGSEVMDLLLDLRLQFVLDTTLSELLDPAHR